MILFDIEALADALRGDRPRHNQDGVCPCKTGASRKGANTGKCFTTQDIADLVGVSKRTVDRRISDGGLDWADADAWAQRANVHPMFVWPGWEAEADRQSEVAA